MVAEAEDRAGSSRPSRCGTRCWGLGAGARGGGRGTPVPSRAGSRRREDARAQAAGRPPGAACRPARSLERSLASSVRALARSARAFLGRWLGVLGAGLGARFAAAASAPDRLLGGCASLLWPADREVPRPVDPLRPRSPRRRGRSSAPSSSERRRVAGQGDRHAGQRLDGGEVFLVAGRGQREGPAGAAGAAGAADAVDVVLGMDRDVEVEDVADVRDVEAARRDVGGDEERHLAVAEAFERGHARALVHVAMQRDGGEAVPDQGLVQERHLGLAVAEDDGVLEVLGRSDQAAQRLALVGRSGCGCGRGPA